MTIRNRSGLEEINQEHRLLAILRFLSRLPAHTSNAVVLRDCLNTFGVITTLEETKQSLDHLRELSLCGLTHDGGCAIAKLTERGSEVAEGRLRLDGIAPVEPSCPY
jgi:hypothetical protein